MSFYKSLFFLFFTIITLNAQMQEDIVFVENKDSQEISLKDEFVNPNTRYYTLTLGTLVLSKHDPIEFFKINRLTNAVAYKFGEDKEYARVISGVYETGTQATNDIKNLHPRLKKYKPYSSKIKRHQKLFKEFTNSSNLPKKSNIKTKSSGLKESKNSVFIEDSIEAKRLKEEFFKKGSKYYSIALGTVKFDRNSIKKFFDYYDVGDKALAHLYGKNKDKVRIIYGLYPSKKEAREAIKNFSRKIKVNKPFYMNMSKFQSFYGKSFPNTNLENDVVEFKVNEKKELEKHVTPKLSDEIKIVENPKKIIQAPKQVILPPKVEEKKTEKPKVIEKPKKINKPKPVERKVLKKIIQKSKPKQVNKNSGKFLKPSQLEDVYYVENKGSFNILSEVFLNDGSSFFTVDFGEIKLNEKSIEEFLRENNLDNEALAYKYGDNKEFARIIYGAFENKISANKAVENLNVTSVKDLKVSNIKNHQKLYKVYHKIDSLPKKKTVKSSKPYDYYVAYSQVGNKNNRLKDEFFNRGSSYYTITLITYLKDELDIDDYFAINYLYEDTLAFPIGSQNSYYRVIYGLYKTQQEAKDAIDSLSDELKKNLPYVSRIRTNQRKFESYNGRTLEEEFKYIQKIEFR